MSGALTRAKADIDIWADIWAVLAMMGECHLWLSHTVMIFIQSTWHSAGRCILDRGKARKTSGVSAHASAYSKCMKSPPRSLRCLQHPAVVLRPQIFFVTRGGITLSTNESKRLDILDWSIYMDRPQWQFVMFHQTISRMVSRNPTLFPVELWRWLKLASTFEQL